jgi:hypothetical protein
MFAKLAKFKAVRFPHGAWFRHGAWSLHGTWLDGRLHALPSTSAWRPAAG